MRSLLGFLGIGLVIHGVMGLLHEIFDWSRFGGVVGRIPALEGYEVYASIGCVVLGVAVALASDLVPRPKPAARQATDAEG